jgi:hypothetical protein
MAAPIPLLYGALGALRATWAGVRTLAGGVGSSIGRATSVSNVEKAIKPAYNLIKEPKFQGEVFKAANPKTAKAEQYFIRGFEGTAKKAKQGYSFLHDATFDSQIGKEVVGGYATYKGIKGTMSFLKGDDIEDLNNE